MSLPLCMKHASPADCSRAGARFLTALLCLAAFSGLGGCALPFDPGPAPTRLYISPAMPAPMYGKPSNKQIIVARPLAPNVLDSERVALVFGGREVRYLADVRWAGSAPRMLQRSLLEALEAVGGAAGVGDERSGLAADARLLTDIKDFSLHYASEGDVPTAVLKCNLRLVSLHTGKVLGIKSVDAEVRAAGTDTPAMARAVEATVEEALAEAAPWVMETLRQDKSR